MNVPVSLPSEIRPQWTPASKWGTLNPHPKAYLSAIKDRPRRRNLSHFWPAICILAPVTVASSLSLRLWPLILKTGPQPLLKDIYWSLAMSQALWSLLEIPFASWKLQVNERSFSKEEVAVSCDKYENGEMEACRRAAIPSWGWEGGTQNAS